MSSKKHVVFIVNPKSGTDRVKAIQSAIDSQLDHLRFTHELLQTRYARHGTELAREAAEKGAYAVIAVGGDGSVNDIVAGLLGSRTILGIIPKGSGNGMARTMNIPLRETDAIALINQGKTDRMDIGYANDRPFVSNAGVGFDALIAKKFAKSARRGMMVYSWLVAKYLWLYNEWQWRITIDGHTISERAFLVNVANGQQFGYDFKIAPEASWTDGLLDVVIIRKFPKLLGGMLAFRAMKGSILKSPFVKHYRAKEISIVHPDLKLMQTDGDAHPTTNRIHFRVQPAAQEVFVP